MISSVSSETFGIASNSLEIMCDIPFSSYEVIRIEVIAYPWIDDRRTLLKVLPTVVPKPVSNGYAVNFP